MSATFFAHGQQNAHNKIKSAFKIPRYLTVSNPQKRIRLSALGKEATDYTGIGCNQASIEAEARYYQYISTSDS